MNTTEWIRGHAGPLGDPGPIVAAAKAASVVGIGENTREAAEIDRYRVGIIKALVEEAGYRIIVIPDSANVAERMDAYVLGRRSDLDEVVRSGWLPNRTESTAELLSWVRAFNERRDVSPVRFAGNGPAQAEPEDYDRVVAAVDAGTAAVLRERYEVIRTAHDFNEHLQIHQGVHPGRPFAELAGEALELVRAAAPGQGTVDLAERIVSFHANSVAAKHDFAATSRGIAERIANVHEESGQKVVYFDGFALTGVVPDAEVALKAGTRFATAGSLLRERFGDGYVSVLLAFGHGVIRGGMRIPEPREGLVERALFDSGVDGALLPLREDGWPGGPVRLRIIAGVYDPAADGDHSMEIPDLAGAVDYLGFVRTITQTRPLPGVVDGVTAGEGRS
ncbi:erythromycin esterase family protein [Glycomyces sp. MUSA5-2]|uniref:erythromycin esterase family protein n=1 Tax=Glycomyces sp. MUSA5-2 TaxID=2053002 RepID=UPI0030080468